MVILAATRGHEFHNYGGGLHKHQIQAFYLIPSAVDGEKYSKIRYIFTAWQY